ncbi:hypothetical protein GXP67_28540 [Rhodocytophaga rosea]|uniref:Uncharacterized protein n=1 Tax=Rhodocytophaga rosea TaxID=2704465 RepID=A0A6C0GS65_9BACT|nr:hypothetical protein [Rhodocytophaga rosea]QHT70320.1 hypothetical protein GXP67_28540 [Rhodocytophaga rosea]
MIDKQLLKEKLNSGFLPHKEKYGNISLQYFNSNDFIVPESEQVIVIIKDRREDFTDAAEFFMQSVLYYGIYFGQQFDQNYLRGSLLDDFKFISLVDAQSIVEDFLSTLLKKTI